LKKFVILKNGERIETQIAKRDADVVSMLTKRFEPRFSPQQWRLVEKNRIEVSVNSHSDIYEVKLESEWLESQIPPG